MRDLRVTLAPDGNNELVLEVINSRLDLMGAVRAGRVYWRDGAFWWSRLAEPERLPDVTRRSSALPRRCGGRVSIPPWCLRYSRMTAEPSTGPDLRPLRLDSSVRVGGLLAPAPRCDG